MNIKQQYKNDNNIERFETIMSNFELEIYFFHAKVHREPAGAPGIQS